MDFTGERWIPGKVEQRIEDDHIQRYVFAAKCSTGKRVLDIACGVGAGAFFLATKGAAAYIEAVDLAADAIAYGRETYQHPQLSFHVGNIETYKPLGTFDMVTCFETIEHVPDEMLALKNVKKWITPGGMLVISSPHRAITSPGISRIDERPSNPYHVREFTPTELKDKLTRVGFTRIRSYGQRLRWQSNNALMTRLLDRTRNTLGINPDRDSSAVVRPVLFRTPRYFVLTARA